LRVEATPAAVVRERTTFTAKLIRRTTRFFRG
jgi:hypothetical protein